MVERYSCLNFLYVCNEPWILRKLFTITNNSHTRSREGRGDLSDYTTILFVRQTLRTYPLVDLLTLSDRDGRNPSDVTSHRFHPSFFRTNRPRSGWRDTQGLDNGNGTREAGVVPARETVGHPLLFYVCFPGTLFDPLSLGRKEEKPHKSTHPVVRL